MPCSAPPDATSSITLESGRTISKAEFAALRDSRVAPLLASATVDGEWDVQDFMGLCMQTGDSLFDSVAGAFYLAQNRSLLAKQLWPTGVSTKPVVVCGSGPSLDYYASQLRAVQGQVTVFACHTTNDKLLKRGIVPDFVCPLERVGPGSAISLTDEQTAYAGLPIVPDEWRKFSRHFLVGGPDKMYDWLGIQRDDIAPGITTGTLAVSLASTLTSGPIYLVGMDGASGHCAGYDFKPPEEDVIALCVDGVERQTNWLFAEQTRQLGERAALRPIVQCGREAAVIQHATNATLPNFDCGKVYISEILDRPNTLRSIAVLADLPAAMAEAEFRVARASTPEDLDCSRLIRAPHDLLLSYMFQSLYVSMSIERRLLGIDPVPWAKEAMLNALTRLRGYWAEMA